MASISTRSGQHGRPNSLICSRSALDPEGLRLVRIDLSTPSALLDQIVRYEAVHPIRDSQDLARRLAKDRRCYAFFHPTLPQEPLIFTEVALTHRLSADVRALLDPCVPHPRSARLQLRDLLFHQQLP